MRGVMRRLKSLTEGQVNDFSLAMKFWQLESICRWHGGSVLVDELSDPRWREFEAIYRNYTQLVETQNREKLDKVVNPELVQLVVSKLNYRFSLNNGVVKTKRKVVVL